MRTQPFIIAVLLLAGCCCAQPVATETQPTTNLLAQRIAAASKVQRFVAPNMDELRKAEQLFQITLKTIRENAENRAEQFAALVADWQGLQMQLQTEMLPGGHKIWLLSEDPEHCRGRGFYAFRIPTTDKPINPIAIEAPHSFFDKYTRSINVRLFENGNFAAASWNTVKRSQVDLAHTRFHYLNSFTTAFANTYDMATIVQLHGFSKDRRKSPVGKTADLIVSDGTRSPSQSARLMAARMQATMDGFAVKLFPEDVGELGATTNAQGKTLRTIGHHGFLHLEMSQNLRMSLRRNASVRDEFLNTLNSISRN